MISRNFTEPRKIKYFWNCKIVAILLLLSYYLFILKKTFTKYSVYRKLLTNLNIILFISSKKPPIGLYGIKLSKWVQWQGKAGFLISDWFFKNIIASISRNTGNCELGWFSFRQLIYVASYMCVFVVCVFVVCVCVCVRARARANIILIHFPTLPIRSFKLASLTTKLF